MIIPAISNAKMMRNQEQLNHRLSRQTLHSCPRTISSCTRPPPLSSPSLCPSKVCPCPSPTSPTSPSFPSSPSSLTFISLPWPSCSSSPSLPALRLLLADWLAESPRCFPWAFSSFVASQPAASALPSRASSRTPTDPACTYPYSSCRFPRRPAWRSSRGGPTCQR